MLYLPDAKVVGNRSRNVLVSNLEYANDLVFVASSWADLKCMLQSLERSYHDLGTTINAGKTKCMAVLPSDLHPQPQPIYSP